MHENLIDFRINWKDFKNHNLKFTVSSRALLNWNKEDIITYLKVKYSYCEFKQIESVFGHIDEFSKLYGGRPYNKKNAITQKQIEQLEEYGIGIALTFTNHFFSEEDYEDSYHILKKHHKRNNSIICTNDELAMRIKEDFPEYKLKGSLIKNINTHEKIEKSLSIYDYVVIPMEKNDDDAFLSKIKEKNRIILFGNGACAYTCPQRSCYISISRKISGKLSKEKDYIGGCSKKRIPRKERGTVFFDVKKLLKMGFNHIKLIPINLKRIQ